MSALLDALPNGHLSFWCPGCAEPHVIDPSKWSVSGSATSPSVTPSILVTGQRGPEDGAGPVRDLRCHSFIRDGRIDFCSDCTHALAAQSIPLTPKPEATNDGD